MSQEPVLLSLWYEYSKWLLERVEKISRASDSFSANAWPTPGRRGDGCDGTPGGPEKVPHLNPQRVTWSNPTCGVVHVTLTLEDSKAAST
jgi:hypothetical protein